ncbi:hydrolase [Nonomuraea antimicrobica]|uniref:Hydrolase n=1 Tax=Nonomuraea antimicrobica TaxID=561173 RepID=A0ABP7BFI9_9ACTN
MDRSIGVVATATLAVVAVLAVTVRPASAAPRHLDDLTHRGTPVVESAPAAPRLDNIAHRGGAAHAPENTIAACALSREQGADTCEFDVQQTKDHRLVLMHDETLARTTDVEQVFPKRSPWRVADFTLAEIQRLDAGSWFSPRFRGEGVPTLKQVLQAVRGSGTGLLLEIKHPPHSPDIDRRVATELREERDLWRGQRLTLQAFGWQSMRVLHSVLPDVPVALLGKPEEGRLAELARYADGITTPHGGLTPAYVRKIHEHGMRVYTWTADKPGVMRRLMSYGVDGIMTNRPDVLDSVRSA